MQDGTGSGSWSCQRGYTRAVAWPGSRAAARTNPDAARPERDQPRPHTRPRVPAACRRCRPARSAFFDSRIGVADARHPVLAVAQRYASFTPGAALLPAQTGLVQGAPDRERADPRQPIRGLAQGFLQQAQGPGGGAIMLALGRSRPLG